MKPYTRNMNQTATYWPPADPDGFGGVGFGEPETLKCRWQDKAELFRDVDSNEVTSSSVVYPAQALQVKGYLFLGESAVADPTEVEGAKEIRQVGSSPNLKGTRELHKVWL